MLINIFQITFFNQYVISPKTWIHRISSNNKIIIIFTILLLLPYSHHLYILLPVIFSIIALINLPIPKYYLLNLQQTLFILFICFSNIYIHRDNFCIHTNNNTYTYVFKNNSIDIPKKLYINKCSNITNQLIYQKMIPPYIFKGAIVYLIYLILLKILYLTTKYENIITSCILIYKNYNRNTYFLLNTCIVVFTSQFIIILINKVDIVIKALIIRELIYKRIYYGYALQNLLDNIFLDIQRVSFALHYREILCTDLKTYKIN